MSEKTGRIVRWVTCYRCKLNVPRGTAHQCDEKHWYCRDCWPLHLHSWNYWEGRVTIIKDDGRTED